MIIFRTYGSDWVGTANFVYKSIKLLKKGTSAFWTGGMTVAASLTPADVFTCQAPKKVFLRQGYLLKIPFRRGIFGSEFSVNKPVCLKVLCKLFFWQLRSVQEQAVCFWLLSQNWFGCSSDTSGSKSCKVRDLYRCWWMQFAPDIDCYETSVQISFTL